MSISSISTAPVPAAAAPRGRASEHRDRDNLLFTKRFEPPAAHEDMFGDAAELAAMLDLAELGGGNNDSAAFAARTPGAGEPAFSVDSLRAVLAEGGVDSWLVSDDPPEEITLADLRAEVMGGEVLPSYGLARHAPGLPDPAAPDYLEEVRRRLIGIGEAGPAPSARDGLDRVLREERACMTERMVAALSRASRA